MSGSWTGKKTTRMKVPRFLLLAIFAVAATKIGSAVAFVAMRNPSTNQRSRDTDGNIACGSDTTKRQRHPGKCQNDNRNRNPVVLRDANPSVSYEYIPPNPDASPGSFHMPNLRSSYPEGTPAGLRGEAVRSALVTTDRCIGWNLSTNAETSIGGLLEISGRGTLDFLNGKLTRDFRIGIGNNNNNNNNGGSYREACMLDAKGRLIDVLKVTLLEDNKRALILTSPGHSSADLTKRLDPFVFPMDEVTLTNFCNGNENETKNNRRSFAFTLASTQYEHVRKAMQEQSKLEIERNEMVFPTASEGVVWRPSAGGDGTEVLVVPSTGVSSVACVGYTFVFFGSEKDDGGSTAAAMGQRVWERLIGEENLEGPVEVGALEYETLRVEAGQPAYGHEYGIDRAAEQQEAAEAAAAATGEDAQPPKRAKPGKKSVIKTGPFELHYNPLIDPDKGCYLGQEGVASVLKNPRGSPRTLYSVVFEDDFNLYESQTRGDKSDVDNLTSLPKPGQKLYALGSNEELQVGTITSMGEAGGTGSRFTVGLALIRRAESIKKKMDALDLEIPRDADDFLDVDFSSGSGIIQPPPMDPLEGLEVIVEGTFTMGVLKGIPSRQSGMRRNSNMFDADIEVEGIEEFESGFVPFSASTGVAEPSAADSESIAGTVDDDDDDDSEGVDGDSDASLEQIEAEVAQAAAEAEAAAAEAKRKAEKMEMLKKRAEEAMVRRKQKAATAASQEEQQGDGGDDDEEEDAAAAEAKRKADKMAMLKKRADEAMARRKAKKEEEPS